MPAQMHPQVTGNAAVPNARREPQASDRDLEDLWQQVAYRFGDRVPRPWLRFRQLVAQILQQGAEGEAQMVNPEAVRGAVRIQARAELPREAPTTPEDQESEHLDSLWKRLREPRQGNPAAGGRESAR